MLSDSMSAIPELIMATPSYAVFEALDPYFAIVMEGLRGLVDGEHFFSTFAEDAVFESLYEFPGWPRIIQGRANLMDALSGYGKSIVVHRADSLVAHKLADGNGVILEYEVHGTVIRTGGPYENRLISVVKIGNRKIVHWRDYMDSLAAWTALNGSS